MRAARGPKAVKVAKSRHTEKSPRTSRAPVETLMAPEEAGLGQATPPWNEPGESFEPRKARGFARVPTHAIGVFPERRLYPRAALRLPLRLKRVAGQREQSSVTLLTRDISSSGVFFLSPQWIEPGTPIELEVCLVDRPLGRGSVRMTTAAHIVRAEPAATPGWHGLAATFDDISFQRDEPFPPQSRQS